MNSIQKTKFKETEIGLIPWGWDVFDIQTVSDVIGGGTPSTTNKENFNGFIPWITPRDLSAFQGRFIFDGERSISEEGLNSSSAKLLPVGSVLLTTRAPVGYLAIAKNKLTTNQGFHSLIPNSKTNSLFLFYLLKNNVQKLIDNASGSTFLELNGKTLKSLEFAFPLINEQQKIAEILSSLDDKIELNRKINDNLEKIARALFKKWFVDFEFPDKNGEPYKFNGGKMIDSELGEIPNEWKIIRINEIADIEYGRGEYSKTNEGKYSVFGAGGLVGYSDNYEYENQQLIVGCRGTCGNISITDKYVTITHNSLIVKPKEKSNFNIYSLKKCLEFSEIKSVITGSTQPQITIKDLSSLLIIEPDKNLFCIFNNFITNFEKYILYLNNEIKKLEQIRNSLLPKLMSGKIRVI